MLTRPWKTRLGLFLAAMALLNGVVAWKSIGLTRQGYPDFTIFYSAAKIIRSGQGAHLYDKATQLRVESEFASAERVSCGPLPYNHPPFEAAFFVPLSFLPYWAAYSVWNGINIGILLALRSRLKAQSPLLAQTSAAVWLLCCVAFYPVFVALLQGQDALLFVLLLTLGFLSLQEGSDWAAGCWLGLALFRFHLLPPILLGLLFQKRARALAGFLITAAALLGVSVGLVGLHSTLSYPAAVRTIENVMLQQGTVVMQNMTNLRGLMHPVLSRAMPATVLDGLAIIASLGLAGYAAAAWKKRPDVMFNLGFAACLLAGVLAAYHTLMHDLSVLLLTCLLVADYVTVRSLPRRRGLALTLPALVLSFTPLQAFLKLRSWQGSVIPPILLFWLWRIYREMPAPVESAPDPDSVAASAGA
jgi:hypothetical protein